MIQNASRDVKVRIMNNRMEADAYGEVAIPAEAYWGPQTERSRHLFAIGNECLPDDVIHCFGAQKVAAARANMALGLLPEQLGNAIIAAATEMQQGRFDRQFPVMVWQTGSGTQTNMNANEVIANRANEMLGHALGARKPVHPNDHVNKGQSSNDTFPTIMHISVLRAVFNILVPAGKTLVTSLAKRADEFHHHAKLGMTHLQDALPVTLGMEFRAWQHQVETALERIEKQAQELCELPQGGTASGSGVNGNPEFASLVAKDLSAFVGQPLRASQAPSYLMASHDVFAGLCGSLNTLASALIKTCTDIRLLTSSLGGTPSMTLPDDGLSSSIMPAKRNATVCEAVIQVCMRVIGNSAAVLAANNSSVLQLNTCKPLILNETLNSIYLLADAQKVLARGCIDGLGADRAALGASLAKSPVLGAILGPVIGYDMAARLTRECWDSGIPMRDILERDGILSGAEFDHHLRQALNPDDLDRSKTDADENGDLDADQQGATILQARKAGGGL
ncbi:class II fumarate hydratase (plasmid) [Thalassospira marina]|uniref:fumarate hydratase n=2 Tax=Thalassospira marina TaxID=2048283 RepID=A0ABN5FLN0_9PROT|nr:class II fumarate hydratase [Thalassospira marina]